MFDLMALAFQTDMTRVITVLLAIEQSPRNYPEIGITEGHHGLTHHQGDKAEDRKGDADQRVPHQAVHVPARQVQVDPRRRRHTARQLDDRVRQRPRGR